jgi:ABC-type branched-subunit amino acid transport system ATPase component
MDSADNDVCLRLDGVSKSYGGVQAVGQLNLSVKHGEIRGLIGPNGAGKTTVVNMAAGVVAPDDGRVLLNGRDITSLPPQKRSQLGLARTFQGGRMFDRLTALDNVRVALETRNSTDDSHLSRRVIRNESMRILCQIGLESYAAAPAQILAYGDQKKIEACRAAVVASEVLLLDEPTSGLPMADANALMEVVLGRIDPAVGVLLIEHNVEFVTAYSGTVTVLQSGKHLITGHPGEVMTDSRVVEAYLGIDEPEPS